MILQANFHYEIDYKEKIVSTSGKNGNEIFLTLQKLKRDLPQYYIYLDNTFQKVFAILIQQEKVELIKLPEMDKALEEFIDLVFHISCFKGINTVAFHLTMKEIINKNVLICNSETILQLLSQTDFQKESNQQDKQDQKSSVFALKDNDYKNMIFLLNQALYGDGNGNNNPQEEEQVFSIAIKQQDSKRINSCFLEGKNEIKVLSNFIIEKAYLYQSSLVWTDEKCEKVEPKFLTQATVRQSQKWPNDIRYETILTLDLQQQLISHSLLVFNERVIAFQFPLKFNEIQKSK